MGGVRQHCRLLRAHIARWVEVVDDPKVFTHVQSAYSSPRCDVWTCHGGFVPPVPQIQVNLWRSTRIISVARWVVDQFFPDERRSCTVVIPNGVDLSEWDISSPEQGFVLTKAYNARIKDWSLFCTAVSRLPDLEVISLGAPLEGKVPSNVKVLPPLEYSRYQKLLSSCSVYVSCSSEVCPTMVLESWAARRPVLALGIHGNRELLEREFRECLYEDASELEVKLRELISSDSLRVQLGERGREYVEAHHNWERLAQATADVYASTQGIAR
jgi:glycosyltransferase involved in cell wall biosynthesis